MYREDVFFNIHNLVKFRVHCPKYSASNLMLGNPLSKYKYYKEEDKNQEADFEVDVRKISVPKNKWHCHSSGKNYYGENYLFCKGYNFKLVNWDIEIENLNKIDDGPVKITVFGDPLSLRWISNIIDFFIHKQLVDRDAALVHAAGVLSANGAIMYSGRSGCGKTTLISNALESGLLLLGDNYVILKDGLMKNFIGSMSIYWHNLSETLSEKISTTDYMRLQLGSIVTKATARKVKLSTQINLGDLYPDKITNDKPFTKGFVVFSGIQTREVGVTEIQDKAFATQILQNQQCEFLVLSRLFYDYSYYYQQNGYTNQWQTYYDILMKNISSAEKYRLDLPYILDKKAIHDMFDLFTRGD